MAAIDPEAFARLRADLGGDAGVVREIVGTFLQEAPRLVEEILAGARGGDARRAASAAHTLKSTAAMMGALRLHALCREAEAQARGGRVEAATAGLLEREFALVRGELAAV